MKWRFVALLFVCSLAHAEDSIYMNLEEVINSKQVQAVINPKVRLFWLSSHPPEIAERNITDTYTGGGFGAVSEENCKKAFAASLKNLISTALASDFDLATGIQVFDDKSMTNSTDRFRCSSGIGATTVTLQAALALSADKAKSEATRDAITKTVRKEPPYLTISFPRSQIYESEQFKKALGKKLSFYWDGEKSPDFTERFGPEIYSGYSGDNYKEPKNRSTMCYEAAAKALENIVSYAEEHKHSTIIRVHSWVAEQRPENSDEIECHLDGRGAHVHFRATTTNASAQLAAN